MKRCFNCNAIIADSEDNPVLQKAYTDAGAGLTREDIARLERENRMLGIIPPSKFRQSILRMIWKWHLIFFSVGVAFGVGVMLLMCKSIR